MHAVDPAYATRRPPQLNGGFDEQRPRTIIVDDVLCVAVAFGRGRQHCARCRESELLRRAGVLAGILAEPEASGGHWIQIGDLRLVGDLRLPMKL